MLIRLVNQVSQVSQVRLVGLCQVSQVGLVSVCSKGAGQGFLLKPFCPTVKNSSPLRTLAGAFCVYSLGIGPEQRTEPIYIRIFHEVIRPQPHFASMVTVQKQLSRNKKGQWLQVNRVQGVGAWSQHLFACPAYDSLIIHEELAQ